MKEETRRAVTKREFAYLQIRDLIIDGSLEPGTRLGLRPLAARLGVSVMPVRDAIRALEAEGLVTTNDHQGAYVARISAAAILECVSLRMWLEVYAAVESAKLRDSASIEQASRYLVEGQKAINKSNGLRFAEVNRRFHEAIEAPAGGLCSSLIEDLWNRLWQVRRQSSLFVLVPEQMAIAQQEHEAILNAVKAGEVSAAAVAAQRHRESTVEAWTRAYSLDPNDGAQLW